jgi:hypothetical protein
MAGNYDREIRKAMGLVDAPDVEQPVLAGEPLQTESPGIPSQAIQDEYAVRPTVDWDEILRKATAPNGFTSGMNPSTMVEDRRNESTLDSFSHHLHDLPSNLGIGWERFKNGIDIIVNGNKPNRGG